MFDFFVNNATDLVPSDVVSRLKQVSQYEISEQSKLTEVHLTLENYYNSLGEDERLAKETELENRSKSYLSEHKRDIVKTGIVMVSPNDLSINETGSVPGTVLNQFSIDEYKGNLRIATTTNNNSFLFGGTKSFNDVYVLDQKLQVVGSILDLGVSERIYSARFVDDIGYLVTFRQTDPFYVLDLTDPTNPHMTGELKIPGFSSYLHPLTERLVLGVGREDGRVKVSLFDVSDKSNPLEKSTFYLSDSWSEIQNSHHAFLHDDKHEVFFVPGASGGYVFSYADDEINLETAVSNVKTERALFINDYMYIVSPERIVVLDETAWKRVNELEL
ncbi:MAG: hypothetical protein D6822_03255 [Cyanobacteria bacterium J149]|nr:MAG: hypothetical protein D6822_03255 [Cyanobacteria bacterium J149]